MGLVFLARPAGRTYSEVKVSMDPAKGPVGREAGVSCAPANLEEAEGEALA